MNARTVAASALVIAFGAGIGAAQVKAPTAPADTAARIPALVAFHRVIAPIWHTAYPAKDTAMLASFLPRVKSGVRAIASCKLPPALDAKRGAWEKGVAELEAAAKAYETAVTKSDSAGSLAAAAKLHAKYEALARLTGPKEEGEHGK